MSKIHLWIGSIFFAIGLIFLAVAAWNYTSGQSLEANGQRTTGTVVALNRFINDRGNEMFKPEVEFIDSSGQTRRVTSDVSSSSPSMERGEQVDVIYDPNSPDDVIIDSFIDRYFMPMMFGGLGSVFSLVGGGFLFSILRRRKEISSLKRSGTQIHAEFTRCYLDTRTKLNGRSPYVVTAQAVHLATGKLASFESDPIWLDLTSELTGKQVSVLIDPSDPDDHYVDLSPWVHESERA